MAADACVITCAVSGAVANKEQCPGIPYTPEEYAKEVRRARDAGASMVHIHARDPDGTPTVSPERYRAITQAILAESPDIIINYSTGAVGIPMAERVGHIVELKPEVGALNMGSMNYAKYSPKRKEFVFDMVFSNPFSDIMKFLTTMNSAGVKPELESFDSGHIGNSYPLIDMGVLRKPIHYSLILGVVGGALPTTESLAFMKSLLPEGSDWGVIGVSHEQWKLAAAAATLGGNVRVGYEDNFYLPDRRMAESNGELASAAASIIRSTGREVATAAEARAKMSLPARS